MTEHRTLDKPPGPRPPSPWPGSQYSVRHRWQLDHVRTTGDAVALLEALSTELEAAHAAGWWLVEPMRSGHLLAARASRRQRAAAPTRAAPLDGPSAQQQAPPIPRWRLRVIDESPLPHDQVLVLGDDRTARTPVLRWASGALSQVAGPPVDDDLMADTARQLAADVVEGKRWAVARARVGPSLDLVADGSALHVHALRDGELVRTQEVLTFQHAADGAMTLPAAAAAYRRIARAAVLLADAGGHLAMVDDGLLHLHWSTP